MEIIILLFVFALGWFLGEIFAMFRVSKLLQKIAESHEIDLEKEIVNLKAKEISNHITKLHIESIDNSLFMYEHETNKFICQGNTLDELVEKFQKETNIQFAAVVHDKKVFMIIDGKIKEVLA